MAASKSQCHDNRIDQVELFERAAIQIKRLLTWRLP